jgi:uncharacterized membrane protein
MTEEMGTEDMGTPEITSDDKLWAAFGYLIFIVAVIALFMEDKKNRPFIRYHAIQAIALNVVIIALATVSSITIILAICAPFLWFINLWPAYDSWQGNFTEIPVVTNFIKNQGWLDS